MPSAEVAAAPAQKPEKQRGRHHDENLRLMSDRKKQLRLSLSSYSNPAEIDRNLGEIRQLRLRIRKRVKELEVKEMAQLAAKVEVCKGDAARMHHVVLEV